MTHSNLDLSPCMCLNNADLSIPTYIQSLFLFPFLLPVSFAQYDSLFFKTMTHLPMTSSSLENGKINLITKLIFVGYTGSKNQVQTRKKNQV